MHLTVNFAELLSGIDFAPFVIGGLSAVVVFALSTVVIMLFLKGSK